MRVVVLMSTYNGERFVAEQVKSILEQLPPEGLLIVRDDGSRDATVERIESFNDPKIKVIRGENIGFARSFLTLLQWTPENAEMIMFSDQDDVWLPFKIQRAWAVISDATKVPVLYCSAQTLVDENLRHLQVTPPWPREPSFKGAISENIVTGCTAALSSTAAAILKKAGVPAEVKFHDWWAYLVVSAFGKVVVDETPTILYRQHGGNLIGRGSGWFGRQAQIIRFLLKNDWVAIMLGQINELERNFGEQLSSQHKIIVQRYFSISDSAAHVRWRLIFGLTRWRQTLLNELLFRMLLIVKKLGIFPWRK